MRALALLVAGLALAACAEPIPESKPAIPGATVSAPFGLVEYCARHPGDGDLCR
jgi:hypothetical protein